MSELTFDSMAVFALHLAESAVAVRIAEHHALTKAAKLIEKTAKAEIGAYQPAVGPFDAWAPLADSTVADRTSKGFTPDDPLLRSGELRDSIGYEVSGNEAAIGSTSDVMVYQELGTSKIPPRPVLGPAAYSNKEAVQAILGKAVVHAMEYGNAADFIALPE
jgi:HK97 gp10 family phage protein